MLFPSKDSRHGFESRRGRHFPSPFCRFARAFQCEIGSITPALVQRFLNNLNLSARSVNNFRKTLKTLFEFARARKYLSKEIDLLGGISRQREHSTIEIYTRRKWPRCSRRLRKLHCSRLRSGALRALSRCPD